MTSAVGFGIGLPVVQQVPGRAQAWEAAGGPAEIERVARAADRLGYAHIGCSDHVVVPRTRIGDMGATWYEPIATLAHVGALTERIELLTHVLVLPYHHPLALAKSLATLDRLSAGRVVVGIGSGHMKPEFKILRVPFAERGAMTDEYVDILRTLWSSDEPAYEGRFFQFRDVVLQPRPQRRPHPPIWIGGNSRRAVRRSIERGDGWVPWQLEASELRALIDYGRELRGKSGVEREWEVVAPLPEVDLLGMRDGTGRRALSGVAADLAERIDRMREMGASRFQIGFASRSCEELIEQLEAFAVEVMEVL